VEDGYRVVPTPVAAPYDDDTLSYGGSFHSSQETEGSSEAVSGGDATEFSSEPLRYSLEEILESETDSFFNEEGPLQGSSSTPIPPNNEVIRMKIEKPKDFPWSFSLFPLRSKEKRLIVKQRRWHSLQCRPNGAYEVAPVRSDILDFQRKFWIYRNMRQILIMIGNNPSNFSLGEIKWIRNSIFKYLGNGTSRKTDEQRSLLSQTFYAFRKHRSSTRRG